MNNVIDLNRELEINALVDKLGSLISDDQPMTERTISVLKEGKEMKSDGRFVFLKN